jgi:hypothetical protein
MDPFVLLFILLICVLPLLIGFLSGRAMPALPPALTASQALTVFGGIAVSLTLLGVVLAVAARGIPGNAALGVILLGVILMILGYLCACFGCGLALGTAQRLGQQAWFVVLLFTALFPLVAALAIVGSTVPLAIVFSLIGAMALVAYGISGLRAARPTT